MSMSRLDEILAELSNTIPSHDKLEFEYETLADGKYVWGLVKIKNVVIKPHKKAEVQKDRPGYQLSFRAKDHPKAFLNIKFAASTHERAKMMKYLIPMSEGRVVSSLEANDEDGKYFIYNCSKDVAFNFLKSCLGKWFTFSVEQVKYQDKTYMNIVGSIKPQPGEPKGVFEHFDTHPQKDMPTGFESYPDAVAAEEAPKPTTDDDDIPW